MDFAHEPEDEAFRDELRAWLDEHLPKFLADWGSDEDPGGGARRGHRPHARSAAATGSAASHEGRWAAINWPKDWDGREATPVQNVIYSEEMARVRAPGIYNANGIWQIGPMIIALGHRRSSSEPLAARDPLGRRALVPGLQRAAGRLRPREPPHHRDPRRRRVRRQRPEDLDLHRAPREVGSVPLPHRPGRDRARREARGHHRVHHRHGDARHRVPPDPRHRRRRDVQRGVVHRRPHPRRLPARRRRSGLAGRDGHARPRARRHGRARDHDGGRTCGR